MIEIDSVTKRYGERRVVDRLSLTVPAGDFCVLLGSSGCGKSTTLRMINRLIAADSGSIRVAGEDIRSVPAEALRRRIGYAIQSIGLFPHWTAADNILAVPRLLKWSPSKSAARLDALIAMLRIDPALLRRYPKQLSGGQQQRIGVARALAADPDIILMDEPFAALDPVSRVALQEELRGIHARSSKTIVFVTHNVREAACLGNRAILFSPHPGRIREEFKIDLERPRDINSTQLAGYSSEIMRALKGYVTAEVAE